MKTHRHLRGARGPAHVMAWLVGISLLCTIPALTIANTPPPQQPIRIYPHIDLPLVAVSAALSYIPTKLLAPLPHDDCFPCDPATINPLDRSTINWQSAHSNTISNALIVFQPLMAVGVSLAQIPRTGSAVALGQDLLLMFEAVALAGMTTTFLKLTINRPRPYMYVADPPQSYRHYDEGDYTSFPSGHTAIAFAIATSMSTLYTIRHPRAPSRIWLWAVAVGIASTTGILRVYAGKHFWTDTIIGTGIGTTFGVLVPMLHRTAKRDNSPPHTQQRHRPRAHIHAVPTGLMLHASF